MIIYQDIYNSEGQVTGKNLPWVINDDHFLYGLLLPLATTEISFKFDDGSSLVYKKKPTDD